MDRLFDSSSVSREWRAQEILRKTDHQWWKAGGAMIKSADYVNQGSGRIRRIFEREKLLRYVYNGSVGRGKGGSIST